jgi:polysaccharide transporter, PST family
MIRKLAANNVVLILQYAVNALVPLLLVPHIVRELGLAQFGTLAIALALANYGALIVQYGFHLTGPSWLNRLEPGETPMDVVWRIASAKTLLLTVVILLMALATGMAAALGQNLTNAQIWLLIAMPVAAALNTGWHLQVIGRFGSIALLSSVGASLSLILGFHGVSGDSGGSKFIAALALTLGPISVGAGTLVITGIDLWRRASKNKLGFPWRRPWSTLIAGWPLFASQFISALYTASGAIVVGVLAGVEEAGAYGAVERVSSALVGACLLIHTAAYPTLVQLYGTDRTSYIRLMRLVVFGYLTLAAGAVLLAALAWQSLLGFLFGTSGAEHGMLLAAALIWILLGIFGTALTGYLATRGDANLVLPLTMKVLTLSFFLGVPGTFLFGAWAWMAALCAAQVLVLAAGWRAWAGETRAYA